MTTDTVAKNYGDTSVNSHSNGCSPHDPDTAEAPNGDDKVVVPPIKKLGMRAE
jgi:hypothetical protein